MGSREIEIDGETRRLAATLGRRYFAGTVTFEYLFGELEDVTDPLILALLEALLHEPRKGFFGVSESQWQRQFATPVSALLDELERGEAGQIPSERVYPKVTLRGILGWSLFPLATAATTLDNAHRLYLTLREATALPYLVVALRSLAIAVLALLTLRGVRAIRHLIELYRTRHDPYALLDEGDP